MFLTGGGMGGNATENALLERRHQSSPGLLPPWHAPQDMASLLILDELLSEIFVRLPTQPTSSGRPPHASPSAASPPTTPSSASTASSTSSPSSASPILTVSSTPADPPHPSTFAAEAFADFSLSFLPAPASDWNILDVCDGRVLLYRRDDFTELVVCDSLHRRHLLLPPIPKFMDGWVPSVDNSQISLVGRNEDASEETFFRVIYVAFDQNKQAAFVFSSSTGQ